MIPDPRNARGQRYAWTMLLTLLAAGLASGPQTVRAIAQWIPLQAAALRAALPTLTRLPSESTLLRTLRQVDVTVREAAIATLTPAQTRADPTDGQVVTPCGTILQAQAVDGKAVRGATACGTPTHLVSLVQHGSGTTLAQDRVATKQNEITAVPTLLAGRDLTNTVTTMDALLTQRTLAHQIREQHGHDVMIVKANQPHLRDTVALFFDLPAIAADHEQWDRVCTVSTGHGRLETRTLECTTGACAFLDWPGATQLLRRTCERTILKTGKRTVTVTYGITRLPPAAANATLLETRWRGHWTIESRSHDVRDVILGEDGNHMHTGNAPQALAALRNGLLTLGRCAGWTNIADAVRAHAASVPRALAFIGVTPTLT